MITVGFKKNKPKKSAFEISEDFLAQMRKMDQAKKLLSTSD